MRLKSLIILLSNQLSYIQIFLSLWYVRSRFVNAKKIFEAFDLSQRTFCVPFFIFHYPALFYIYEYIVTIIYRVIGSKEQWGSLIVSILYDRCRERICHSATTRRNLKDHFDRLVACPALIYRPYHDVKIPLRFSKAMLQSMKPTKFL